MSAIFTRASPDISFTSFCCHSFMMRLILNRTAPLRLMESRSGVGSSIIMATIICDPTDVWAQDVASRQKPAKPGFPKSGSRAVRRPCSVSVFALPGRPLSPLPHLAPAAWSTSWQISPARCLDAPQVRSPYSGGAVSALPLRRLPLWHRALIH